MKSAFIQGRKAKWLALPLLALTAHSYASNIFDPSVSASATINTSAVRLDGTIHSFNASANVWTIDVFANVGECVRLDLNVEPADMELVVVAPNGSVFRNDDRNGALDRRPLVKIASAPNNGWYTVHVSQFAGTATEGNFTLLYGRYTAGNANCGTPTPASVTAEAAAMGVTDEEAASLSTKGEGAVEAPRAGTPGSR
jgi:hypothetical protein